LGIPGWNVYSPLGRVPAGTDQDEIPQSQLWKKKKKKKSRRKPSVRIEATENPLWQPAKLRDLHPGIAWKGGPEKKRFWYSLEESADHLVTSEKGGGLSKRKKRRGESL